MISSCVDGKHAAPCLQLDGPSGACLPGNGRKKLEELEGSVHGSEDGAFNLAVYLIFKSLLSDLLSHFRPLLSGSLCFALFGIISYDI